MDRRSLLLLGAALIVIGAAVILVPLLWPGAPGGAATPSATAFPTGTPLVTPVMLAPATALEAVAARVQSDLDAFDRDTANAARALGPTEMTGNETRRILRELALASPAVIDATAVSRDGVMLTVEPGEYSRYEGSRIGDQEQVRRVAETRQPAMSGLFPTVEGVNATDLEHPVFSPSGEFNGSASLLFNPLVLLTIAVEAGLEGGVAEVFVVDTDGVVLYDRDAGEVGTTTFTDAQYAGNQELLAIAERMRTEREGTGSYTFATEGSSDQVRKEIQWVSVGLHGTEWRVVAVNATTQA